MDNEAAAGAAVMTNSCSSYEGDIYYTARVIATVSTYLSLLSSCLVLFFAFLFKKWSFFNQRLIVYLSLATFIGHFTTILSKYDSICALAGFLSHIGGWETLNAYICITGTLLLKVFFTINLEKLDIPIILIIFGSPFLFNWIPFIHGAYGKAGPICWIRNTHIVNGTCIVYGFGQALQLVLWYIPLYVILSIMIVLYVIILAKFCFHRRKWVKSNQDEVNQRKQALKYAFSLLAYPVVYFVANIFSVIIRVYEIFHPSNPSPVLWLLTSVVYPQQGTGIAIIFFLRVHKEMSITHFIAAVRECCHKSQVKEYAFRDDELEPSLSSMYSRHRQQEPDK